MYENEATESIATQDNSEVVLSEKLRLRSQRTYRNTNYIYWYPWRNTTATEDDSTMTWRWSIRLEALAGKADAE